MNEEKRSEGKPGLQTAGIGRRDFLTLMGVGAAAVLARDLYAAVEEVHGKKPNIILILADDLGYADIGLHGCKDVPTPNIDSIGRRGVRFTNGYVSCPVCSPTRAGIMTGRYQERFGHWYNPGPPAQTSPEVGLPLTEITIADLLKQAGYKTALVGKWHLGLDPKFHPMKRGFDEFFGFLHGAHSYTKPLADTLNPILRGTEPVDEKEYLTDALKREAVGFIEKQGADPFFLYFAPNAVHAPMEAPQKYLDRFPSIAEPKRKTYAAMLSALDDAVGAILETVRKKGIDDNTLIIFLSDNGGPPQANASCNKPLSGAKGTVQEGGVRVPFLIQWPDRISGGRVSDVPVISLDILATCLSAAHGEVPSNRMIDSADLLPYIRGKTGSPHKALFWKFHQNAAIRQGKWKLIKNDDGTTRLYNLSKDIAEEHDLAPENPKRVNEMSDLLRKWEAELKPPLWAGGQPGARARKQQAKPAGKGRAASARKAVRTKKNRLQ
jgi:arylsulfatase A-like enzyme